MIYAGLCLLGIVLQTVFILVHYRDKKVLSVIFKTLASVCFVVLGFIAAEKALDPVFAHYIKLGLIFGLGGDFLLESRNLSEKFGKKIFLVGILVFLVGHVMYIIALAPFCEKMWLAVVIAVVLAALLLWWIFSVIEAVIAFKIFGAFYIGIIVLMNVIAVMNCIALPSPGRIQYVAGAILFLLSDIIMILYTFGPKKDFRLRASNLSLYYAGQLLIALTLLLAY